MTKLDRRIFLISAAALAIVPRASAAETAPPIAQDVALLGAPDPVLEAKIAALAIEAGLTVAFAAVDIGKGRTAFVHGGELSPMNNVAKLPLAVAILRMVQDGKLTLDRRVRLAAADIAPGRSPLAARLRKRPTMFTVRQLIEHMLLNADNTAADALVKLGGGPVKIQAQLAAFDLGGLRIDRTERELQPEAVGLEPSPAFADPAVFERAMNELDEAKRTLALTRYLRDPRDTASPRAVATLIFKLLSGHLIQPRFVMLILDLMRRTKTGDDRLKGGLLPGWSLAHVGSAARTQGGVTAVFHDAGLATSNKGAKIAIVLFIENATLPPQELARFHRAAARAVLQAWAQ